MTWNSLFPRTFKPWELHWPVRNLTDLTDVWLLLTIGIALLACFWAAFRAYQAIKLTGRYLASIEKFTMAEDFAAERSSWIQTPGLKEASEFNDILLLVPAPGRPLEVILKRCASASEVFNSATLAHGLIGNRMLLAVPAILTGLGVLGTFVGLQIGIGSLDLSASQIENLDKSIAPIISGCSTAISTSVWGVFCSLVFTIFEKLLEWLAVRRIRVLQGRLDALIPRYTPEESMILLQQSSLEREAILKGLAVAIGEQMQKAMDRLGSSFTEAVRDSLGHNAQDLQR